jgi:hypothetical protein
VPPRLLLDLDGVLNPTGSSVPPGYRRETTTDFSVLVKSAHGDWLRELAGVFEVMWATTWNGRAQDVFGPLLDLPTFGVLELGELPRSGTRKLGAVRGFAGNRPLAWVDDELYGDAQEWAARRAAPTLLVRPAAGVGLVRGHVDSLLRFANIV